MRVLINAASAHMGGAVTYLQNVLHWLPAVAPGDDFVVYVPEATMTKLPVTRANVEVRAYPHASTQGAVRLFFDQIEIPRLVRQENVDVLFSSTGFGTFLSPCAEVLLVRNMAYFDREFQRRYREMGRSLRKNALRRWHSVLSMRTADRVVFPTNAMRSVVEDTTPISGVATDVIHYGFEADALQRTSGNLPDAWGPVGRWKDDGDLILLNVSTYAVHKNFETLVEALPILTAQDVSVRLVTTTSRERTTDTTEYDDLQRRAEELGVRDRWLELGYVPYDQLGNLYDLADVYVFPSFTESFGHSMVEAMAAGLPLVAAATAVNEEVGGDAGIYFDTFDAKDCARVIAKVLGDDALRAEMVQRSRRRADAFSWERYAEELVGLFQTVASPSHNSDAAGA